MRPFTCRIKTHREYDKMAKAEIKIGDKVKAGFTKPAGLPRKYTEGVVTGFAPGGNVYVKYCRQGKPDATGCFSKNQISLIEAA